MMTLHDISRRLRVAWIHACGYLRLKWIEAWDFLRYGFDAAAIDVAILFGRGDVAILNSVNRRIAWAKKDAADTEAAIDEEDERRRELARNGAPAAELKEAEETCADLVALHKEWCDTLARLERKRSDLEAENAMKLPPSLFERVFFFPLRLYKRWYYFWKAVRRRLGKGKQ